MLLGITAVLTITIFHFLGKLVILCHLSQAIPPCLNLTPFGVMCPFVLVYLAFYILPGL